MSWQAITNAEHHDGTGKTSTSIKHAIRSAAHYRQAKAEDIKQTDALRLGRLAHVMVFEPENWDALSISCPMEDGQPMKKNSNARKAEWAEFDAMSEGRDHYKPAEYDQICAIDCAVKLDPEAQQWLSTGVAEVSGIVEHPEHGTLKRLCSLARKLSVTCTSRLAVGSSGSGPASMPVIVPSIEPPVLEVISNWISLASPPPEKKLGPSLTVKATSNTPILPAVGSFVPTGNALAVSPVAPVNS